MWRQTFNSGLIQDPRVLRPSIVGRGFPHDHGFLNQTWIAEHHEQQVTITGLPRGVIFLHYALAAGPPPPPPPPPPMTVPLPCPPQGLPVNEEVSKDYVTWDNWREEETRGGNHWETGRPEREYHDDYGGWREYRKRKPEADFRPSKKRRDEEEFGEDRVPHDDWFAEDRDESEARPEGDREEVSRLLHGLVDLVLESEDQELVCRMKEKFFEILSRGTDSTKSTEERTERVEDWLRISSLDDSIQMLDEFCALAKVSEWESRRRDWEREKYLQGFYREIQDYMKKQETYYLKTKWPRHREWPG